MYSNWIPERKGLENSFVVRRENQVWERKTLFDKRYKGNVLIFCIQILIAHTEKHKTPQYLYFTFSRSPCRVKSVRVLCEYTNVSTLHLIKFKWPLFVLLKFFNCLRYQNILSAYCTLVYFITIIWSLIFVLFFKYKSAMPTWKSRQLKWKQFRFYYYTRIQKRIQKGLFTHFFFYF